MIDRKALMISGGMILALFASGLAGWAFGPTVPMDPLKTFFFAPAAGAMMWGFFLALRRMDTRRGEAERPLRAESRMLYVTPLLMGFLQAYILSRAFGADWGMPQLIFAAIGLFWMIQGNVMGKLRPGHPLGMKNPWTAKDPRVWDQTHRFGGWLMTLAGAGTIALGFTLTPGLPMVMTILSMVIGAILLTLLRSWMLWRKLHPGEPSLPLNGGTLSMAVGLSTLIAIAADFALEQGRSGGLIAVLSLLLILVLRFVIYRRQRR